jgi:DNA (cytosine-5)-methyltransferase 1
LSKRLRGEDSLSGKYPLTPLEVFEGKPLTELQDKYYEIMNEYKGVADEVNTPEALKWKKNVWEKLRFDVIKDYLFINKIIPWNEEEISNAFKEL